MVQGTSSTSRDTSVRLVQLTPEEDQVLTDATVIPVKAVVAFNPSLLETVEYFSTITVNGRPYEPFRVTITPGAITGTTEMSWFVHVSGKQMNLQFSLYGIGQSSGDRRDIAEVWMQYVVRCNPTQFCLVRAMRHLCGCCS